MKKNGRPGKPITVEGKVYPSIADAAQKLNMPRSTLLHRMSKSVISEKRNKVFIGGRWYESPTDASKKLDVPIRFLENAIKIGLIKTTRDDLI